MLNLTTNLFETSEPASKTGTKYGLLGRMVETKGWNSVQITALSPSRAANNLFCP